MSEVFLGRLEKSKITHQVELREEYRRGEWTAKDVYVSLCGSLIRQKNRPPDDLLHVDNYYDTEPTCITCRQLLKLPTSNTRIDCEHCQGRGWVME